MKLVTFDLGRVGRLDGEDVIELGCASTREWFERGGDVPETGERLPGDVVEASIEGIGTLRNYVVPWSAAHEGPPYSSGLNADA